MRCVLGRERFGHKCPEAVDFPQWCYTCQKSHQSINEIQDECRISPVCYDCSRWLHDSCGRSPGFVDGLSKNGATIRQEYDQVHKISEGVMES